MSTEIQNGTQRRFLSVHGRTFVFSIVLALLVLVAGAGWLLFQPSQDQGSAGGIGVGQSAPAFSLNDSHGQAVDLTQFRGHPLIINFWASYCAPCRGETPLLEQFYQAHQSQGLVILGIDEGESLETVIQYQQDYQVTYPLLLDPYPSVS